MNTNTQNNTQVISYGPADQAINEDDVNYAIKKLARYNDRYSRGIVTVFINYLEHKDFNRMRSELEILPQVKKPSWLLWDVSSNMIFLEVIYPVTEEGGHDAK